MPFHGVICPKHGHVDVASYKDGTVWCQYCVFEDGGVRVVNMKKKWIRARFRIYNRDPRPVKFPPPGPYWVTGEGEGYSTVVAYLPDGSNVLEFWPEMTHMEWEETEEIRFSDRFPQPAWWPPLKG